MLRTRRVPAVDHHAGTERRSHGPRRRVGSMSRDILTATSARAVAGAVQRSTATQPSWSTHQSTTTTCCLLPPVNRTHAPERLTVKQFHCFMLSMILSLMSCLPRQLDTHVTSFSLHTRFWLSQPNYKTSIFNESISSIKCNGESVAVLHKNSSYVCRTLYTRKQLLQTDHYNSKSYPPESVLPFPIHDP